MRAPGRSPARWLPYFGVPIAAVGTTAFAVADNLRAGLSFLGGMATALIAVALGSVAVLLAAKIAPRMALLAAMWNYLITILLFLLLLSILGPRVISVPAFALGLACAVVPYLAWQFARARPCR